MPVDELLTEIDKKIKKLVELKKRLDYSLMVQSIWSDAFTTGSCDATFRGSLHAIQKLKYVLKRKDGMEKEFDLIDVPQPLIDRLIDRQVQMRPDCQPQWEKIRGAIKALRV